MAGMLTAVTLTAAPIGFADPIVKQICVDCWDTDGDHELSEAEAAAVATLGTVFKGRKDISTFNELRYFSGLTAIADEAFRESSLREVSFPPTVAEIGRYAFAGTQLGSEVVIPGTVKTVRAFAFSGCRQMRQVVLEDGVESVYTEAFTGEIHYMQLPSTITYFAPEAVIPYTSFGFESRGYVFCMRVESAEPVNVESSAFRQLFGEGVLIVPPGSSAAYKSSAKWSSFYEVTEVGDVNRDGRVDVADLTLLIAYIGGREHTDMDALIADINGDGVLDGEDVSQLCQYLLGS